MQVGDPLTEAVCWNAAWDLVTAAELSAAEFAGLVARRVAAAAGRATAPPPGLAELLERAVTGADYYAAPQQRPALRERVAAAALDGARMAPPGRPAQRALAAGFAASAHSDDQLDQLRAWLGGRSLPAGLPLDDDLRARMLATLAARGLAGDDDLAALAADPVTGQAHLATCRALRPEPAAKQAAWSAALDGGQPARLAQAHARGIWAPGQETLLAPYVDRYFTEALAVLRGRERRAAQQLARLLYPVTLADPATIAATDAALRRCGPGDALRPVLAEQRVIVQQMMTARARTGGT
jgi:aminopeptidase N